MEMLKCTVRSADISVGITKHFNSLIQKVLYLKLHIMFISEYKCKIASPWRAIYQYKFEVICVFKIFKRRVEIKFNVAWELQCQNHLRSSLDR